MHPPVMNAAGGPGFGIPALIPAQIRCPDESAETSGWPLPCISTSSPPSIAVPGETGQQYEKHFQQININDSKTKSAKAIFEFA